MATYLVMSLYSCMLIESHQRVAGLSIGCLSWEKYVNSSGALIDPGPHMLVT